MEIGRAREDAQWLKRHSHPTNVKKSSCLNQSLKNVYRDMLMDKLSSWRKWYISLWLEWKKEFYG